MKKFYEDARVMECIDNAESAGGPMHRARAKELAMDYQGRVDAGEIIVYEDISPFAMEDPLPKKATEKEIIDKAVEEYTKIINRESDRYVLASITENEAEAIENALAAVNSSVWLIRSLGIKLPSGYTINDPTIFRRMLEEAQGDMK